MEKVPRVLWWLFGGLVVLTAGVLVDVIPPSHGHNPPAVKKVSSSIAKPMSAPSPVLQVSYAIGYSTTVNMTSFPVVAIKLKNATDHLLHGYVSFKAIFENPAKGTTNKAEAIFSGPYMPGYATQAQFLMSSLGYKWLEPNQKNTPHLIAVIFAQRPGVLVYHEVYKASVPLQDIQEWCNEAGQDCSYRWPKKKQFTPWITLYATVGHKVIWSNVSKRHNQNIDTASQARANTFADTEGQSAQEAHTKTLQHDDEKETSPTDARTLQQTAEAKAKLQAQANIAADRAERAAEDARLSYRFAQKIRKQVLNAWTPNFAAALACALKINLSPTGQIIGQPIIVRSSRNPKFDRAVIVAVEQAAPFVPPKGLPYHFYKDVSLTFNAKDLNHG